MFETIADPLMNVLRKCVYIEFKSEVKEGTSRKLKPLLLKSQATFMN